MSETFLLKRKIQQDIIMNVPRSSFRVLNITHTKQTHNWSLVVILTSHSPVKFRDYTILTTHSTI
jgi:hypothetical protein